jgi:hypothetical protein
VVNGKQKMVTDGPFAEAKDVVGGFSLIQARDLDQARWSYQKTVRSWRLVVRWKCDRSKS